MVIYINCPHCDDMVEIIEINCGIFRHGVYKKNGIQMGPHTPKEICDEDFEKGLIYGCGKPFRLEKINSIQGVNDAEYNPVRDAIQGVHDAEYNAIRCEYI